MIVNIIQSNNIESFKNYLMSHDVNEDIYGYGKNICYFVIKKKNIEMLNILIDKGVNLKYNIYGTALHQAINEQNLDILKILINHININEQDEFNWTVLHYAISKNNYEISLFLLENGSNTNIVDSRGFTPLHLASQNGNYQLIVLLLKYGADKYIKNSRNKNPRELAESMITNFMNNEIKDNYLNVVKLLS